MNVIAVYVPNPEAHPYMGVMPLGIAARSGIVGTPMETSGLDGPQVLVDYEGDLYGASNISTYADRVYHAASRHQTAYPTVARGVVRADQVIQVATYYPEHKRVEISPADLEIEPGRALFRLTEWLGYRTSPTLEDITHELRETR